MDRNSDRDADWVRVYVVALRKESVDRNTIVLAVLLMYSWSLSARRAWIEIMFCSATLLLMGSRSPQGERG